MEENIATQLNELQSNDKNIRYQAFTNLLAVTENKVEWVYDLWDKLVKDTEDPNNHKRAIAVQLLCQLTKSDYDNRIFDDFETIWKVTKDERFVTARHSLQSIWKIALAGPKHQEMVVKKLTDRFTNCIDEKNYTLIRYDILQGLRNLFDVNKDESIKEIALQLIEIEEDFKYRKKYAGVWKNA